MLVRLLVLIMLVLAAVGSIIWLIAHYGFRMRVFALYIAVTVFTLTIVGALLFGTTMNLLLLGIAIAAATITAVAWLTSWPLVHRVLESKGVQARW